MGGVGAKNFSVPAGWAFFTHTFTVTASNPDQSLYFWINKVGSFYLNNIKLEEGNKSSAWSLAPEDLQAGIDKAQSTADSKIRTFYSDTQPSTPSGGFKVGDLWYKINTVDGCYETYRWNGSGWVIINVNVSKSRIEQTDSRITSVVEKTGIDNLGTGETLWSKINQTANEISLEVSQTQIGGSVNLLRNTAFKDGTRYWSNSGVYKGYSINTVKPSGSSNNTLYVETTASGSGINSILTQAIKRLEVNKTYTLSFWASIHGLAGNIHFEVWGGIGSVNFFNPAWWQFYTHTFTVTSDNPDQSLFFWIDKVTPFYINNIQLVEGDKALGWQPSQEDTLNEIGSKLTINQNKISLASTTIELKGQTIADAISAGSLDVGNGNFHVGTDGIISAKGANISGTINADKGSIGGFDLGSGRIGATANSWETGGYSGLALYNDFIKFSQGSNIWAGIGTNVFPASSGGRALARFDNSESNPYNTNIAAYIKASGGSENIAISMAGGCISGLAIKVRQINATTYLTHADVYVSCYNKASITVYLPSNPETGKVIYLRQMNPSGFTISGNGKLIHTDGNTASSTGNRAGQGDTTMLVFDGQFWNLNYMIR